MISILSISHRNAELVLRGNGGVLLVLVLFLYWIYDRVVGIDNMKLG